MSTLTSPNSPAYTSPLYNEMKTRWDLVTAVRHVNETIQTNPGAIIPKGSAEGLNAYETRKAITWGFEALDEVIHALVGLACRHDPKLQDDVPEVIRTEWEDIDLQGTHGSIFTQHCLDAALEKGQGGILADYPPAPEGLTLAQEQAAGLRPYLVLVPAERVTAWRTGRVRGRFVLTMVKLREDATRDAGAFGTTVVERYRTLYQRWDAERTWVEYVVHERATENKDEWIIAEEGQIRGPQWIPFHPFYGGEKLGILRSRPPLMGLAYSNLEHTQKKSQRAYSMHKTAVAIPIWVNRIRDDGIDANGKPNPIRLNSDNGIDCGEGGNAFFMEGAGPALAPLREDLQDLERLMGSQGFSMMRRDQPGQQTATEKEMQATREESKLARAVRSVNDALEGAIGSMAAFHGLEDGGSIELTRDFSDLTLSVEEMKLLADLEERGLLTWRTFAAQLQAGGRLLQGVNLEKEEQALALKAASEPLTDPTIDPATGEPFAKAA